MAHHRMQGRRVPRSVQKTSTGKIISGKIKAAHAKGGRSATVLRKRRRDKKREAERKAGKEGPAPEKAEATTEEIAKMVQAAAKKVQSKAKKVEVKPETPALSKKEQKIAFGIARRHRGLYEPGAPILLVGEGNFSFAKALCSRLSEGDKDGAANVYATCYDGEAALSKKYEDAAASRKEIEDKCSATTLSGVDGKRLHDIKEFRSAFRRVVWNFPHSGTGEADVEKSCREHRELLTAFFVSAEKCLSKDADAAIHVSLKEGEPYKSWKIVQTFRAACPDMDLREVLQFSFDAWPGYEHRRTHGFDERVSKKDNVELAKGAKIYVFVRKEAMPKGKKRKEL